MQGFTLIELLVVIAIIAILDPDKLISGVLFVDGNVAKIDFSPIIKHNPARALDPGKDYDWFKPRK